MDKLVFSLTLIISGLLVGYILRLLSDRGSITLFLPIAFNSLVAASIYDLDLDLANACAGWSPHCPW